MQIGKTLYVTNRKDWRKWLSKNHDKEKDIWLVYFRKATGKPRIEYNDAVEEALCFGWIDSIEKGVDKERFAQRFSPRKKGSNLSPTNIERIKRLIAQKKMTKVGLLTVSHAFKDVNEKMTTLPEDIEKELKKEKETWDKFKKFPESYKQIRIGWIEGARKRPEEFKKRLQYFLKMTKENKKFGMVQ